MGEKKADLKQLKREIKRKRRRWRAGKTKFTERPLNEFRRSLGLRLPDEVSRGKMRARIARAQRAFTYPSPFDWRDHSAQDWTTPIKDQGTCGSCVAFGVVAAMEARWSIIRNNAAVNLDLSEAHLFFCGGSCGCSFGWWVPPALTYAQEHGVTLERCFPYQDHDLECGLCTDWTKYARRATAWREITNVDERKSLISTRGPLVGTMDVYEDFRAYTGGVYQYTSGERVGGHCICVVGYDDKQGCWICKNSWGTDWGEAGGLSTQRGWFRIAYGECGIDTDSPFYVIDKMEIGGIAEGADQGTSPCCLSALVRGTPYEQDLALLRDFRDTHLLSSATAQKYIDLYYNHTEALIGVLLGDRRSRELAFSLLNTAIDAIRATGTPREFGLTEGNVKDAMELIRRIAKRAPRELQQELVGYQGEIEELLAKGRGKKLVKFTRILQKHGAKRGKKRKVTKARSKKRKATKSRRSKPKTAKTKKPKRRRTR